MYRLMQIGIDWVFIMEIFVLFRMMINTTV